MQPLIMAILTWATPLVGQAFRDYAATHNGELPTDDEAISRLHANVQAGNLTGAMWKAANPPD